MTASSLRPRLFRARSLRPLLVAAALAAACSPAPAGPLRPEDFHLDEARAGMSARELRAALGEPKASSGARTRSPPGSGIVTWRYDGLDVTLVDGEALPGFALTGPGRETARGLRVGDAAERVRELYGEPAGLPGRRVGLRRPERQERPPHPARRDGAGGAWPRSTWATCSTDSRRSSPADGRGRPPPAPGSSSRPRAATRRDGGASSRLDDAEHLHC